MKRSQIRDVVRVASETVERLEALEHRYSELIGRIVLPARRKQLVDDRNEIASIRRALAASINAGGKPSVLRRLLLASAAAVALIPPSVETLANADEALQEMTEIVATVEDGIRSLVSELGSEGSDGKVEHGVAPFRQMPWGSPESVETASRSLLGGKYRLQIASQIANAKEAGELISVAALATASAAPADAVGTEVRRLVEAGMLKPMATEGPRKLYIAMDSAYWAMASQVHEEILEGLPSVGVVVGDGAGPGPGPGPGAGRGEGDGSGIAYTESELLSRRRRIVEQLGGNENLERIEKDPPDISTEAMLSELASIEEHLEQLSE